MQRITICAFIGLLLLLFIFKSCEASDLKIAHSFNVDPVKPKNFTRSPWSVEEATKGITSHAKLEMEFETGVTNFDLIQPDVSLKVVVSEMTTFYNVKNFKWLFFGYFAKYQAY